MRHSAASELRSITDEKLHFLLVQRLGDELACLPFVRRATPSPSRRDREDQGSVLQRVKKQDCELSS